jgi:hydrogenase maturation protein HypF
MAEHNVINEPVLGVAWDGTGYGLDDTIWGGEFLKITPSYWQRIGHFKTFSLLGNHQAIKDPRRIALAFFLSTFEDNLPDDWQDYFSSLNTKLLRQIWHKNISPITSSVGRLFDGVAALIKLIEQVTFEGQGAMALESQVISGLTPEYYSLPLKRKNHLTEIDWRPLIRDITMDFRQGNSTHLIATKFHNSLVKNIVAMAQQQAIEKVALGGGCFQNRYLLEQTIKTLRKAGFCPLWPQKFPPNDGGLCLGQLLAKIQPREYLEN